MFFFLLLFQVFHPRKLVSLNILKNCTFFPSFNFGTKEMSKTDKKNTPVNTTLFLKFRWRLVVIPYSTFIINLVNTFWVILTVIRLSERWIPKFINLLSLCAGLRSGYPVGVYVCYGNHALLFSFWVIFIHIVTRLLIDSISCAIVGLCKFLHLTKRQKKRNITYFLYLFLLFTVGNSCKVLFFSFIANCI